MKKESASYIIGVTTRSLLLLFFIPFTVIWAGISFTAILGQVFIDGKFSFLVCLFAIPFILGSIFLIISCLLLLMGKEEVRLTSDICALYLGIGIIGWRRTFKVDLIKSVRLEKNRIHISTVYQSYTIGNYISNKRRKKYLYKTLKLAIKNKQEGKNYFDFDLSEHLIND